MAVAYASGALELRSPQGANERDAETPPRDIRLDHRFKWSWRYLLQKSEQFLRFFRFHACSCQFSFGEKVPGKIFGSSMIKQMGHLPVHWFRPFWCHQSFTLVKLASLILGALGNTFKGYPAIPQLSKQGRLHPKGWQYFQEVWECLIAWCSAMIEAGAYTKKVLLPFLLCWCYTYLYISIYIYTDTHAYFIYRHHLERIDGSPLPLVLFYHGPLQISTFWEWLL